MMTLTAASVCTGIGGFDKGFEDAGITPLWMCEIDPVCRAVLRRHWPEVPIYEDIQTLDGSTIARPDILMGGTPCQDISVAGKRAGLAGARSGLFFAFTRLCRELRPAFAVWENVPGAFSSNAGRDFASILVAFRECGARDLAWRVLDSRYFGVAQRRRRVFVVADFRGERAGEILFERESLRGDTPAGREAGEAAAGSPGSGIAGGGERGDIAGTPSDGSGQWGWPQDTDRMTFVAHALTAEGADASEDGTGRGPAGFPVPFDVAQITSKTNRSRAEPGMPSPTIHAGGGAHVAAPLCIKGAAIGREPENGPQRGEITEDGTAFTLNCTEVHAVAAPCGQRGGKGPGSDVPEGSVVAFDWQSGGDVRHNVSASHTSALQASQTPATLNGMTVRRLTPTECERLQAYPDGWTTKDDQDRPISDSARYRMLGNACTVSVCAWIARRIVAAVDATET